MVISIKVKKNLMLYVILLLFIYNIKFVFLPSPLRTRLIIGIIGTCYFIYKKTVPYTVAKVICGYLCLIFISLLTSVINQVFDFWFIQYCFMSVLYLLGAAYIGQCFILKRHLVFSDFALIIVNVIIIHNAIAFSTILIPPLRLFITSFQTVANENVVSMIMSTGRRALGLGDGNYFHGGVISGIGIILTLYLGKTNRLSIKRSIIITIFIILTGIFIARTTLIGLLGFAMILSYHHGNNTQLIKICIYAIILGIGVIIAIIVWGQQYIDIGWAFEIFLSFMDGNTQTASTNRLMEMYEVWPHTLKTWIIGDGLMCTPDGHYYMGIDVGYLRILYYIGILGLAAFWLLQAYIIRLTYRVSGYDKQLFPLLAVLLAYNLIINIKGFIDVNMIVFPILTFFVYSRKHLSLNENRISY